MSEYNKPEIGYIVNYVMEYIAEEREIDPWTYQEDGFEIDHGEWPIQIQDVIKEDNLEFNQDELQYEIDVNKRLSDQYEVRSIDYTGGDYVDIDQFLSIRGKIGLKIDPETDNSLIIDYESTDLDLEISFDISDGPTYAGESPPF